MLTDHEETGVVVAAAAAGLAKGKGEASDLWAIDLAAQRTSCVGTPTARIEHLDHT